MDEIERRLRVGAESLGLRLNEEQLRQLLSYAELIGKWSRVYNLTAVRDPEGLLRQHLLDSLAAVPLLDRWSDGRVLRLADVGSGAGLPGVVIAICRPTWFVDCIDTVAKKVAFVQQVAATLGLEQLRGVHTRVEVWRGDYDVVCSRAFASLADFTALSFRLPRPDGVWFAMKGREPTEEIAALPPAIDVFHVEQLTVPELDAQRCIVWMRKKSPVT